MPGMTFKIIEEEWKDQDRRREKVEERESGGDSGKYFSGAFFLFGVICCRTECGNVFPLVFDLKRCY